MKITKNDGAVLSDTTMPSNVYMDVTKEPFKLHGFCEPFRRVPKDIADVTSPAVSRLSCFSAGGRVSFRTNSKYISVHGDIDFCDRAVNSSEFADTSFDIYFRENGKFIFKGIFKPSQGTGKGYVESRLLFDGNMHEVFISFPINAHFTSVYIGLDDGCILESADDYKYTTPVVFYGSSIVHGIGASRPSAAYPSIISHRLDTEFMNLGFSGNARAEIPLMEYIATLPMSIFVYDYDYNAPTAESLEKTHYRGYEIFRKIKPDTPFIMASKPDYYFSNVKPVGTDIAENECRRQLIMKNYERAVLNGDKNIFFIDGSKIYPEDIRDECTFDGCHPNDMGYRYMADAFGEKIKEILKI